VATADTSTIADVEWKHFFVDPSLQKLITRGIKYNYDLQIAIKRLDEARVRFNQTKYLQLPQLNLQVTAETVNPSNNSLNGISVKNFLEKKHIEDYSLGGYLSWEADIWGKIRRQKEATVAQYLQTFEGVRAVQTQLVADISRGYYNLLMLDAQLLVAKRNLLLNDTLVRFTRLQRDAGEITTLGVQQAEAQRKATAVLIPQIEQDIVLQEHALSILTGTMPDSISRGFASKARPLSNKLSAGIPAAIVSRRPDVRASEMALIAANAEVGVAQAYMYPTLNIVAGGGINTFLANNWFTIPASLFGSVAGSLTQPVFQRKQIRTNIEVAKIRREQAVLQFRQSVLQAVTEVSDALIRGEKLTQISEISTQRVDTLRKAIGNAQLLFKSGLANYLEVITAQENFLQAELNLELVKRQQFDAVIELYRALGGGWK
jgi:NodT family efflux transporter outer membrane factor (OMF) lipoprotein